MLPFLLLVKVSDCQFDKNVGILLSIQYLVIYYSHIIFASRKYAMYPPIHRYNTYVIQCSHETAQRENKL